MYKIPIPDDGLQGDLGSHGKLIRSSTNFHWRAEDFVQFLKTFRAGPGVRKVAPGKIDDAQGPPFLQLTLTGKLRLESLEKGDLPVQIFRQAGDEIAQA